MADAGQIKKYIENAYLAKIMQMNDLRRERENELLKSLSARGHGRNSGAHVIASVDIEEDCIAELLHQKADLYIDIYERNGLKIGPDVLKDLSFTQASLVATRKATLMSQADLTARRTNQISKAHAYAHLGKKASQATLEIKAKIDLYNLTPRKVEPTPVTNNYHLPGTGNRVVHGDDHSTNTITINEGELFAHLQAAITEAVSDDKERAEILTSLNELKQQKTKADYLAMVPKFIAATASVGHVVGPYLPALIERAEHIVKTLS